MDPEASWETERLATGDEEGFSDVGVTVGVALRDIVYRIEDKGVS